MESSAIARYIPQNSKVFSGSGSEPEVMEIAAPTVSSLADRKARMKAKGKQKEVAYHEIIDVDLDEDSNDVVLLGEKVESRKRTRDGMGISLGPSSALNIASNKKGKEIPGHIPKDFNPGSNNFFDLDDYVFDDEYSKWQSRSVNTGHPAGIEAPVPWFPDPLQASMSQPNTVDHLSTSSWLSAAKNSTAVGGPSTYFGPIHVPAQTMPSSFAHIGSGSYYPPLDMSLAYTPGLGTHQSTMNTPMNLNGSYITADMLSGIGGIYPSSSQDATVNGPSTKSSKGSKSSKGLSSIKISSSIPKPMDADVQKKYESFKKFDTVVDHSDHHYVRQNAVKQPPKNWAKKIQDEWRILEKDLPDTISVRVYESRMDLLRAVIIGAEGTPYHDGLFFFDVCFPSNYPNVPPLVSYRSGGLRINPNLYNCGKVCLSLLNTWTGGQNEKWLPGTSTMLQVLVSIQGLILNMKPYFNEPGYAHSYGSVHGEKASLQYNENILILSLKTMVYTMKNPPKHFEDLVIGHFQYRVRDILMACKAYTEGVQVGCLVTGGVQDVDEDGNSCSPKFKNDVASFIKPLIAAFKKIGAKEAETFLIK